MPLYYEEFRPSPLAIKRIHKPVTCNLSFGGIRPPSIFLLTHMGIFCILEQVFGALLSPGLALMKG